MGWATNGLGYYWGRLLLGGPLAGCLPMYKVTNVLSDLYNRILMGDDNDGLGF